MQEELDEVCGTQGDKRERVFHLVLKLKLEKMRNETIVMSLIAKHSRQTKAKMTMANVEKGHAKEAHKAKKLAKLTTTTKLGSTKKLPKTPKGEKEETFGPLNPRNGEGYALIEKESSKGEAPKDIVQVVEQVQSSFDSTNSKEDEEKNPKCVNIMKKPIKMSR
jgi:hypothetical protein